MRKILINERENFGVQQLPLFNLLEPEKLDWQVCLSRLEGKRRLDTRVPINLRSSRHGCGNGLKDAIWGWWNLDGDGLRDAIWRGDRISSGMGLNMPSGRSISGRCPSFGPSLN